MPRRGGTELSRANREDLASGRASSGGYGAGQEENPRSIFKARLEDDLPELSKSYCALAIAGRS